MRFPKIGRTILGVPIIRILVYWGLYWGPCFWKLLYNICYTLHTIFGIGHIRVWFLRLGSIPISTGFLSMRYLPVCAHDITAVVIGFAKV